MTTLVLTKTAHDVYAPADASGNPRGPVMGEAQTYHMEIEQLMDLLPDANRVQVRAAGVGNVNRATAPATIDGVTLATNDLVLLGEQSSPINNGVWVFNGAGNAMTRSTDFDTASELAMALVAVKEGTVNGGTIWLCTVNLDAVIGTDDIPFTKQVITASPAAEAAQAAAETAQAAAEAAETGAESARDDAIAAADSAGLVQIYDTKAAASADIASIGEGDYIEVLVDESQSDARTRYKKESGALVFKLRMDAAVDGSSVTATGATTARTLADLASDLLLTPKNYGAAGDGTTDDTAALNAMIAAARATLNSPLKIFDRASIDLAGRTYRCDGSVNLTGFTVGYGVSFGNGKIVSHATGKIAVDCTNSTRLALHNLVIIGDSTDTPKAGLVMARNSGGTVAGQHSLDIVDVSGTFSWTAILSHASEVGNWRHLRVWNDYIGDDVYGVVLIGDDTGLTQVDSEFETSGHGAFSNILVCSKRMEIRRFKATGITVTAISKANPAVVTFTGTPPANGAELVWTSGGDMVELDDQVTTVANVNAGAGTFELSGVDSTGYTTYTAGAILHYKTGPCLLTNDLSAHLHESLYLVTYGSYPIVIKNSSGELRKLHIDGHVEGAAIQALIRFDNLNSELYIHDFRFRQHNLHTPNYVFAMTGSGETRLGNANIELINFAKTPTAFFDFPTEYGFGPGSRLYIGEASGIANDELGVLRRLPDEVITPDATNAIRRFNGGAPSPAHAQVTFRGGDMFAPLSSTNALAYSNRFLMRVGSSAGPTISLLEVSDGVIRMRSSGGTDFSDFGAHIRTAKMFQPDTGDMILDAAIKMVTATADRVTVIGFGSTATTAALADTDHPCTLAADGTPTIQDADFAGLVFDDTLTTKTWRAVSRKASGTPQSVDTGIAAALTTLYLRILFHKSGAMSVFQLPTPSALGTRVAIISGAVTANTIYAAVISQKNNNGQTAARNLDVMAFDAKCTRLFS